MTEGKNPEDKPSFFDFSEEEARSWPPPNSYQTEDESDAIKTSSEEAFSIDNLLNDPEPEPNKAEDKPQETQQIESPDYVDMMFNDFSSFESEESLAYDAETEEALDILIPLDKKPETPIVQEFDEIPELDARLSFLSPTNSDEKENIQSFDDSFEVDPFTASNSNQQFEDLDDLQNINPSSNGFETDSILEEYDINQAIEEDTSSLPFRTYSKFDYNLDAPELAPDSEEEKKGLQLNRNVIIILSILLLIAGWYGFQTIFSRNKYTAVSTRKRKPPRKEKKSIIEITKQDLVPVWDLSAQKSYDRAKERELITSVYQSSGRVNPFMLPDSVLADLKKAALAEMVKKQAPRSYRRKAYRATLVGVLTSKENTIALINTQEAVFDVVEGTDKAKILKLAIKEMEKAKKNTIEMITGAYIGPWKVTRIDSPKDAFTEAKVYIEHNGETKVLNMGRAEELGIFDEGGGLDNLEEPKTDVGLEDFDF